MLSPCLVTCMKGIVEQTMAKQTVIKQTTRFRLHSIPANLGTIPVSILECPNSTGMRMHQNEKISIVVIVCVVVDENIKKASGKG